MAKTKRKTKPKRGRPPLPAGEALTAVLPIRCRPEERDAFEAAAAKAGSSLSPWIRAALRKAAGLPAE